MSKSKTPNPTIYANGKTGGQCYKDYISWKDSGGSGSYIEHLISTEGLSPEDAKEISDKMEIRYKNNTSKEDYNKKDKNGKSKKTTNKKKKVGPKDKELSRKNRNLINKIKEDTKSVTEGSPSKKETYRKLDKEFNRFLVKQGIKDPKGFRKTSETNEMFNKFLDNTKMSDRTKNSHKSAFNYMQENFYDKSTKGNSIKKALRETNRERNNTKNNIKISPEHMNVYEQNLNHIDKTFRNNYSKDAKGKQSVFKERGIISGYTRWYIEVNGGTYIKNSKEEDYQKYADWMEQQGYMTETKNRHMTALRKYADAGNWDAKPPKKNKDLGIEQRINGVMDRAWRGHEFEKAFDLAMNGTCKKGGGKRPDIALFMLTTRVFAERANECFNMTTEQFKAAVENKKIKLLVTKNNTPRDFPVPLINKLNAENEKIMNLFKPLIAECERLGIEKPFQELWNNSEGRKLHNIRQDYGKWIHRHREKFQDKDRKFKYEVHMDNKGKKRKEIEVEKVKLTTHGLRHAGAQDMFNMIFDDYEKKAMMSELVKQQFLSNYKKEKMALAKKRGWRFHWDENKLDKYLNEAIMRKACGDVSLILGHKRHSITKLYLTRKIDDNTTVAINYNNLEESYTFYTVNAA